MDSDQTAAKVNFEGHQPRNCGEHRTVGPHRAWCFDCQEWCYPEIPCERCEKPRREAAVGKLLNAQEAMLQRWAEAALPGQRLSDVQQELWRALHEAADHVREVMDIPKETADE